MSSDKVLVVTSSSFPGTTGDAANYLEMIMGLRRRGIRIVLICPKHRDGKLFDEEMRKRGIVTVRVPLRPPRQAEIGERQIFLSPVLRLVMFYITEFVTTLAVLLEHNTRRVLIRHCIHTINLPPLFGILKIRSVADGDILSSPSTPILHVPGSLMRILAVYERAILKFYTYFLVSTPSQMGLLTRAGFVKSHIVTKSIGIDVKRLPVFSLENIPKNTFGIFGVLEEWQNVDHLLRAWAKAVKRKPAAKLFIIGDGSLKNDLKKLASDLKVMENTVFLDGVPRETLWNEYFRLFRVVVIPRSLKFFPEAAPIKLIEALSAGKPVIASRVPGIAAMVNEKEGVVFTEPDNEESLARTICQLIDNDQRLFVLSKQALKASRKFDLDLQLDGLAGILTGKNQNIEPSKETRT
jgi:glycosyltransferase involved in cell wall biosynthesis